MYKVIFIGVETECYGELEETSNFEVVCDDENDDGVWCDGNPNSPEGSFDNWDDVVVTLQPYFKSNIIEIHAV